MRENRTYGSEGGEDLVLPDPYQAAPTSHSHGWPQPAWAKLSEPLYCRELVQQSSLGADVFVPRPSIENVAHLPASTSAF